MSFPRPPVCPIAVLSERANTTITNVSTSIAADGAPVTEFLIDADAVPDDYDRDPVFTYTDRHLYRVRHDAEAACPCVCLGAHDTPVNRYRARDGELQIVFHGREFDTVQAIVGELRAEFADIDIQRLVRAPTGTAAQDTAFVDRGQLTDRQLEVLTTAYEAGYFERPRGATAQALADDLGIAPSTFTEHLLAAQRKLLGDALETDGT
ncbi:helix-turn-helix domain-containing protein [Halobacterium salinarum]|nr:helix-turn-helix domain-containing protein [Halobacterium salinarum]MDL0126767.1 helix-turn-helix domain-containing protein [Halobacterium salinarum]MDL0131051.1 helix-turn-helix domain-containing protein [Halobacterium salinarum]